MHTGLVQYGSTEIAITLFHYAQVVNFCLVTFLNSALIYSDIDFKGAHLLTEFSLSKNYIVNIYGGGGGLISGGPKIGHKRWLISKSCLHPSSNGEQNVQ